MSGRSYDKKLQTQVCIVRFYPSWLHLILASKKLNLSVCLMCRQTLSHGNVGSRQVSEAERMFSIVLLD